MFRKVGAEEKRINAFFSLVEPRKLMHWDVVEKFQQDPICRATHHSWPR